MSQGENEQLDFNVRTVFISDIHLGTKGCQADVLLDFLKYCDAQYYYLVGDIVDGWRLKRSWYWPRTHNDVVQKLLRKARCQTASNIYHLSASKFFHFISLFRTIFAVLKSVRIVPGFQDVAMVRNTIEQCRSHFCITKDLYPFTE